MVNPFKKKKEETETLASGRVIITDFRKIKKSDFPWYQDMFFMDYDGRIYLDSGDEANEEIVRLFKILVQYPKAELQKWEKEQKKKYPYIKTANDLEALKGNNEELIKALAMLLIPAEIKSRETQRKYYGIL